MKLEINSELVLSTCHVTQEEAENGGNINLYNYSNDECNSRYLVESILSDAKEDGEDAEHFYPNLLKLAKLAQSLNCKWLVLDCDGPEVKELPTFEW